ncbi:Na+ dependent nucleoside transporter C-terminus-domain-containing protein [Yarrowia lipolytica]|nr:hypothetical protein YALI1_C08834g [Yarrowia lipolytica]KAB8281203.1 Na+ dependent nucleoside transporter C-terminus-domain-containing protein [Yarrowia lipolytica]KAE8170373.1 Na+ dependent nucleoside transporter C-terminus-domain-containing protein [Yarrowia lipolytica]RMI95972.1 Na+ dependent nucleoside transporter C-terminus-domain-containing protein [Yarrowia lipolytica]
MSTPKQSLDASRQEADIQEVRVTGEHGQEQGYHHGHSHSQGHSHGHSHSHSLTHPYVHHGEGIHADGPHNIHPDPALDPHNQHIHTHPHHARTAHKKPTVYADLHIPQRDTSPPRDRMDEPTMHPPHSHYPADPEMHRHSTSSSHHVEDQEIISTVEKMDEKGGLSASVSEETGVVDPLDPDNDPNIKKWSVKYIIRKYRWCFHIFWGVFFTAWWISIVAQDKHRHMWLIPTILWMFIMARLITLYLPARYLLIWANWIWQRTVVRAVSYIPPIARIPLAALGCIGVILLGTFVIREYPDSKRSDRAISFFGCIVAIFALYVTSNNRKAIKPHTIITGMLMQYIVALFVLRTKAGYDIFNFISFLARKLLEFAKDGVAFITTPETSQLGMFFFTVLPAVLFFIAFIHIFFYWGWIQWGVCKFAYFFFWTMSVSGAESVVAAASPFIGQGESAILIKPFIPHLTKAEIHQIMASGFATISGSTLVAYIGMGINPQAVVSSCIMSIPGSIVCSKLRFPETEETLTSGRVVIPEDDTAEADNVLHAFANGAWLGLVIAGAIMTTQLCIIALVALINALLTWFGGFWNIHDPNLTIDMMLGYLFYPVGFLLGTPRNEIYKISKLIGVKIIQNEFVAYGMLSDPKGEYVNLSKRGAMLATYALCGFANVGSVGTQIGVLGKLAPGRSGDISKMAISALITGAISTLLSACVAGMVLADMTHFLTPIQAVAAEAAAKAAGNG